MQFQFDIASTTKAPLPVQKPLTPESVPELLRQMLDLQRDHYAQMLELQREQLNQARAAAQDNLAPAQHVHAGRKRIRGFPITARGLSAHERSYVHLLASLVEELSEQGEDALDSDFAVQEFLDRFGMKIGQLSHLLGIIGPLSEAAQQNDAAKQQEQAPPQA